MHYHIVGIAGAGMSAIANILLDQGHVVSGSDLASNQLTEGLQKRGARIFGVHDAAYVQGAEALVVTSAVREGHPELVAARASGIPIYKRADLWRVWSQGRAVIAIAGTHGKTTTTAMVAHILSRAGLNPGFLIGGSAPNLGVNGRWGAPDAPLVIEADEYDRTFLALDSRIAVVTNVEWDHVDIYPTQESYVAAFQQFAAQSHVCIADESWPRAVAGPNAPEQWVSYGFGQECRWQMEMPRVEHGRTYVNVQFKGTPPREVRFATQLAGTHNARNAVAALAVAHELGLNLADVTLALMDFRGTARRFELKGETKGVTVIDDYAHYPTEVRVNIEAARMRYGNRRLVVYVQPHTYSRTKALLDDWPAAFADADVVLVGDIYGAREQVSGEAVSAQILAERIGRVRNQVQAVGDLDGAVSVLRALLQPGDVLLTMGAGDGYLVGERILQTL